MDRVRLASLLKEVAISAQARYVVFFGFDRSWNSLDLADAIHQQTLLAYGVNASDLETGHGAPVRLHTRINSEQANEVSRADQRGG